MFICNHCPVRAGGRGPLRRALRTSTAAGRCSSSASARTTRPGYPDDAPAKLLARWRAKGYGFPYLVDASQDVARAFDAVTTPDIYVFDRARRLAYHGRIDDDWKDATKVTRRELAAALDAVLAGTAPAGPQLHSIGCSIKWKA
jgi:hypothetical protein